MKKVLVSLGAVAMSLAIASPAFAVDRDMFADRGGTNTISRTRTSLTTVSTTQNANLSNSMTTVCNSGNNRIGSVFGDVKKTNITSGGAECGSEVTNTVNKADVTVNAKTTVGSESAGPTVLYTADRGGDNLDESDDVDVATVDNDSTTNSSNSQTSASNTGDNETESVFGDVKENVIVSGLSKGVNVLTNDFNRLMLSVLR